MAENNKIAVVFRSKSGFTKAYATMLANELNCDLLEGTKVKIDDLLKYDTILYGGGMYARSINGAKLITKHFDQLKEKKLILFAVGSTPVREETTEFIRTSNITKEQMPYIQFFYLRGGFDYNRLRPFDKFVMSLLKIKLKSLKNPDADQKGLLAAYNHPLDFTNNKNIKPILDFIKG